MFQLLDLQLMDRNFRRYILTQLLIIFQYLTAQVKFKKWVIAIYIYLPNTKRMCDLVFKR